MTKDWKKKYSAGTRFSELPAIGPFRIMVEPEEGKKGQLLVKLETPTGRVYELTTYESTVGNILLAQGDDDKYVEAYTEKGADDKEYIRFKEAEFHK